MVHISYFCFCMILRFIYILFIALFATACSDDVKVPKDILPKDKMVAVMADMHIAEAAVNSRSYILGNQEYLYYIGDVYKHVYKSHKITKAQFDKSYAYYSSHPELFNAVYQDVISELSNKQAEAVNAK